MTDIGLLIGAVPLLLFSSGILPWTGLACLFAGGILRGIRTGVWLIKTPLNRPIAVLLIMTMISLYPSIDFALSMPKFFGMMLGFLVFFGTVSNVNTERHFWFGIWMLVAGIVTISLLGMVGTEWASNKFPFFYQAYDMMPRLVRNVQTSFGASAGFHSNEVGGTLAFLLPLPIALIFGASLSRLSRAALGAVCVLGLGVLVLTASRSSFMGVATAAAALAVWRWRRIGTVVLFVGLASLGIASILASPVIEGFLLKVDVNTVASSGGTLAVRSEIWARALYLIEDFPFTGIGLNTFPVVVDTLYPFSLIRPDANIAHAHNIFLQTAVDLGVGGLLGFVGLWACLAYAGWAAYRCLDGRASNGPARAAIAGLMLGFLCYLIFGLTDAITLGAKPTVLLWLMMGLLVSVRHVTFNNKLPTPASQPVRSNHHRFQSIAVRSLLVTVWEFYWGLTFAVVGLGFLVAVIAISWRTPW